MFPDARECLLSSFLRAAHKIFPEGYVVCSRKWAACVQPASRASIPLVPNTERSFIFLNLINPIHIKMLGFFPAFIIV